MKPQYKKLFLWHLLLFLFYYELRVVLSQWSLEELRSWLVLKYGLLNLSSFIIFWCYCLGAYWVLIRFYPKKITFIVPALMAVIALVMTTRYFVEEVIFPATLGFDNYYDTVSLSQYIRSNLFYAILHTTFSVLFFFITFSAFKERQRQQLEVSHQKTELSFLRSQVNPHFLFNTLNNIYSLVYHQSNHALPALEKLTRLLRYSLYEIEQYVSLEKEVEMINLLIALEKMRHDYLLQIDFTIGNHVNMHTIPPLILLPLVENAFKHGDTKKPIELVLNTSPSSLYFEVQNHKSNKQKDASGGIGLPNIKKRLTLIYGDRQQLEINQTADTYVAQLVINWAQNNDD